MRFRHIRIVVVLGAFAIIGIAAMQVYILNREWNNKQKQFDQTVAICLRGVAEKMHKITQSTPSSSIPVRQLSSNYFVVDVNSPIDANILEYYLKSEFARFNILTDFEYSIYNCESGQMEYGNYFFYDGKVNKDAISVNLPKYTDYNYYFGVNFPKMKNTIMGDMSIWFFMVGILGLSVIFFAYSIFVILKQKRFSELQRDFINTLTHEFKTPIASINLAADVVSDPVAQKEPSRIITYGTVIKQEVNRLNDQVDKVLQIARIEKSNIHLNKVPFDLNEMLRQIALNVTKGIEGKAEIALQLHPGTCLIEADKIHASNLFYNLIDNAIKYSGESPRIEIATNSRQNTITATVSDHGPGIDKSHQKKVFQKFYRVPTNNVHDVKGFGLGLYYVKSICDAHRWKITLDPEYQSGCRFTLEIPKINNRQIAINKNH